MWKNRTQPQELHTPAAEPTSVQWGGGPDCWPLHQAPGAFRVHLMKHLQVPPIISASHPWTIESMDGFRGLAGGSQPCTQAAHVGLISGECKVCTALTSSVWPVTSSLPAQAD